MKNNKKWLICFVVILPVLFLIKKIVFHYNQNDNDASSIRVADSNIFKIGDINMDGRFNSADYILVRKYLLNIVDLSNDQKKLADMNSDNTINSHDYIIIRKVLLTGDYSIIPTPRPTPVPVTPTPIPATPKPTPVPVTPTPVPKYEVKFYGSSLIETGLSTVVLEGAADVPVKDSNKLSLSTNTSYVVSFDYKVSGGENQFDVDLYPDDLPQQFIKATTTNQHYDWELSSSSSNMSNCQLRFFDDIKEAGEQDITISNITLGIVSKVMKSHGETLGNLPTPTRANSEFLGWFTSPTGGNQVSSGTTVSSNMILYSHWKVKEIPMSSLVITEDSKIAGKLSGYVVRASANTDTLKYKVYSSGNSNYSLIWVKDAYNQVRSGLPKGGYGTTDQGYSILEYRAPGKAVIGVNASFFYNSSPEAKVYMSEGVTHIKNQPHRLGYNIIGITRDGLMKDYGNSTQTSDQLISAYQQDGVQNTITGNYFSNKGYNPGGESSDNITLVCQVDRNNFVLFSGLAERVHTLDYMWRTFGCRASLNLDGGGSARLYHRSGRTITAIWVNNSDRNRSVADMLYFVE